MNLPLKIRRIEEGSMFVARLGVFMTSLPSVCCVKSTKSE